MRILLVDDELELVTALAERLVLRGIDADWALSGEQALEKVRAAEYDAAVLDYKMPGMSGLEVIRKITLIRPDMKFIIVTGHASEQDDRVCRDAGACFYLMKPLKIEALIERLKEAIG
ncbi:MAG: response regulator [Deltaproteobacteria bacterium]|nr:response regulator [Deltaproteobacteria bacterium]